MAEDVILDISHVTKQFPGVTALKDVSIQIKRGEIHGLCGENGAGKSTLMKILCGVYPHGTYEGTITYDGKELAARRRAPSAQAIEEGIAIVYQELTLVPKLTVGENIFLGKEPRRGPAIDWDKLYADTAAVLKKYKLPVSPFDVVERPGRRPDADDRDRQGAGRERPNPDPGRADLRPLRGRGRQAHGDPPRRSRPRGSPASTSRHKLEEFFRITDSVSVLRDGRLVTTQPTRADLLACEKLVSLMVGREMKERFPKGNRKPGRGLPPGARTCTPPIPTTRAARS